jgi:hypothetical protein
MNMTKHSKVIITLAVVISLLLIGAAVYSIIFRLGTEPSETLTDETTLAETESDPDETITVPEIEGNSVLSEDRQSLLDENIIKQIERITVGSPVADEDGNYITDENGELIYEAQSVINYINYEANLSVIINEFADAGYSDDAIAQVQRFYYEYADVLAKYYDSDEIIEKLMECFRKSGNTPKALTSSAKEIFGFIRGDDFEFVFEPTAEVADIKIAFCVVKINYTPELTADLEQLCIYDEWHNPNDEEYERTLKSYLYNIIESFAKDGYNNHDIVLAQLLYAGYIADTTYRADYISTLMRCIPKNESYTYDDLRAAVLEEFGADISGRRIVKDYLDGNSIYLTEVEN